MSTMMILSIVLLVVGVGLLCVEIFMPGFGVFGIFGFVMIVISAVLTVIEFPFGIFLLFFEFVVSAILLYGLFRYIKKRQLYGRLILDETLKYQPKDISQLEYFLGKEGITKTVLKPFGSADIEGYIIDVWAEGVLIEKGKKVKIIRIDGQKLVAEEVKLQ